MPDGPRGHFELARDLPICNMDLIARKKSDAQILPSGVLTRMQISPYRVHLAGVQTVAAQTKWTSGVSDNTLGLIPDTEDKASTDNPESVWIPYSALVFRSKETSVFLETMPNMFDAVLVQTGDRIGNLVEITSGLQNGQRVVARGSFLLDAESRLNPHLSIQYFGANQQNASSSIPKAKRVVEGDRSKAKLTDEEIRIVEQQKMCPVTKEPLGSMGQPVFVQVKGRLVALCCQGCESQMTEFPDKYLNWLDEQERNQGDQATVEGHQ